MLRAALLLASLLLFAPARADDAPYVKERVTFRSGSLSLVGYLFRPDKPGRFAGLIWNHGSEKNPDRMPQFDAVAALFVPAGYVVFAPVRRGHGESQGQYIEWRLQGQAGAQRQQLQVRMLEEQVDDQLAGLAYLKGLPFVDPERIAVAGCSYGGIQTLLGAERGTGYRAAVPISPGALSWSGNPVLQDRLIAAARKIEMPVFLIQPPQDASLAPAHVLGEEFRRLGKPSTAKVYPADIPEDSRAHCFGGPRRGTRIWGQDVLAFLAKALN